MTDDKCKRGQQVGEWARATLFPAPCPPPTEADLRRDLAADLKHAEHTCRYPGSPMETDLAATAAAACRRAIAAEAALRAVLDVYGTEPDDCFFACQAIARKALEAP